MGVSQPEMRIMSNLNLSKPCLLGLLVCTITPVMAQTVTPVLDGYAYQFNSNVVIDFNNQIINFNSNMLNCLQQNGQPPVDTSVFALTTNKQVIGLNQMIYNINHLRQGTIYFTSETGDLICNNGIFVDTIYIDGFE